MRRGRLLKEAVSTSYVKRWDEDYTDDRLAKKAGISVNTVRNVWNGSGSELSTLVAIADAADMSIVDVLLGMQGRSDGHEASLATAIAKQAKAIDALASSLRGDSRSDTTQDFLDEADRRVRQRRADADRRSPPLPPEPEPRGNGGAPKPQRERRPRSP